MERQSSQNQPSLNEINQMLSTPTVQLVMNGTQEDQKKNRKAAGNTENRSEKQNNSAIPRKKRKTNTDPEETTAFPKLLASSNLPIDRGAKCQYPNCQSEAQYDTESKCYLHLITHGPKRFTCSNCEFPFHRLDNMKKHFLGKKGCQGEIIDHIDQTMINEWTKLATVCFPLHASGLTDLFAKKLAKSRDVQVVPQPIVTSKKEENEDCEAFFSPQTSSAKQNLGERIFRPQIEATLAPLMPFPRLSQSMNDVRRLDSPTTSRNASIQPNDVPSLALPLMSSAVKGESPRRTQPIQQQDSGLQLQRLTQEVVRLRAENQRLIARAADEKNCKNVAHKLLGEKNTENEMQKEKIRQLQAELDKYVVTLD